MHRTRSAVTVVMVVMMAAPAPALPAHAASTVRRLAASHVPGTFISGCAAHRGGP